MVIKLIANLKRMDLPVASKLDRTPASHLDRALSCVFSQFVLTLLFLLPVDQADMGRPPQDE